MTKDNLDQEVDGGCLPGAFKLSGEMQMPAGSAKGKGDGAKAASGINSRRNDTNNLQQVDTTTLTSVLVEQAVDVVHDSCGLPVAIAAIAGLPGGVKGAGIWGEVIPGGGETDLSKDSIEGGTRVGGWADLRRHYIPLRVYSRRSGTGSSTLLRGAGGGPSAPLRSAPGCNLDIRGWIKAHCSSVRSMIIFE